MTHDSLPPVKLDAGSGCGELHEKVSHHLAWLFARYPVRLVMHEEFEQYRRLQLGLLGR